MTEVSLIFVAVSTFTVVGFLISLMFVLRAYPVVRKFFAYTPQSFSYMRTAWILIFISIIAFFISLVLKEFEVEGLYKIGELISAFIFLSAFLLLFLGFRSFVSSLGVLKVYLKRNIGDYKVILILVESTQNIPHMIAEMANQISADGRQIILALGPTAPTYFSPTMFKHCIWLSRSELTNLEKVKLVGDSNPTEFNLQYADLVRTEPLSTLIGDFLDTYLRMLERDMFNTFWSHFIGNLKSSTCNGVFFVSTDLHPPETIAFLRRYADVVMEVTPKSSDADQTRIKITNIMDNIITGWIEVK